MTRKTAGLILGWLLLASPVAAQERQPWPERAIVTLNLPFQAIDNDFSESLRFADSIRRTEDVKFRADYAATKGPLFDAGAGVRVAKNMGVGVTASWSRHSNSGTFALAVPSPIAANKPLDLTGSGSDLHRDELGVHVQTLYAFAIGKKYRVMLSGGPSVFRVKQDLLRSVEFDMVPGFASLSSTRRSSWRPTKRWSATTWAPT